MTNAPTAKAAGGAAAFINAVLLCLVGFNIITWSTNETGAVVFCATAGIAFGGAVIAHFHKKTSSEPVAVWFTLVGFASSGVGVLLAFEVVTATQGGLLAAVVATGGALLGVGVVREKVSPVEPQDHFI